MTDVNTHPLFAALVVLTVVMARDEAIPPSVGIATEAPRDPTTPVPSAVLDGTIIRACPGPPERGCQGQGIPEAPISIATPDGTAVATVLTGTYGGFHIDLPPGCYVVED